MSSRDERVCFWEACSTRYKGLPRRLLDTLVSETCLTNQRDMID
jgi:hypothetical protein